VSGRPTPRALPPQAATDAADGYFAPAEYHCCPDSLASGFIAAGCKYGQQFYFAVGWRQMCSNIGTSLKLIFDIAGAGTPCF